MYKPCRYCPLWLLLLLLAGCWAKPGLPGVPTASAPIRPEAAPTASESYTLNTWTAEKADAFITDLHQSDDTLQGADQSVHQALLLAIPEALGRFPQASQAASWRWLQAAVWAREGDSAAAQAYAGLIADGLRSGDTEPGHLLEWLQRMEPGGVYTQSQQASVPGQDYRAVLELRMAGQPAYFWLVRQGEDFQVSLLAYGHEFQTAALAKTQLVWQDLTGDGQPEAWMVWSDRSRRWEMAALRIYNVSSGTAQHLDFVPTLPSLQTESWQVLEEDGKAAGLRIELRLDGGDALCEYRLPVEYRPDGLVYRRTSIEQPGLDGLVAAGFSQAQARLCLDLSVDLLRSDARQEDLLALQSLEGLLAGFPYGVDSALYIGLYPPDEADRARFEVALDFAWRGDVAGVRRWLDAMIARPAYQDSPWLGKAKAFLEAYGQGGDLRRACLASQACYGTNRMSLSQLVSLFQPEDWADPLQFLQQAGVPLQQSGTIDFDHDGLLEFWWIVPAGGASDGVWFLAHQQSQFMLNRLDIPADSGEVSWQVLEPLLGMPVYRMRRGKEELTILYLHPDLQQPPTIHTLEQYRLQEVQNLYQSLLNGEDVKNILQSLDLLQRSPYFYCSQPTDFCRPSAQEAYLLALSRELHGDRLASAEEYRRICLDFPGSSYALLACARLLP